MFQRYASFQLFQSFQWFQIFNALRRINSDGNNGPFGDEMTKAFSGWKAA
jgi:hypothetical protein